ncbi:GNAT family N-acetyltransferase [Streptomyces sp. NBC_00433]
MGTYETMATHLETARLRLRPWEDTDAEDLRALFGERGGQTPTLEQTRVDIEVLRDREAAAGVALLPMQRREEGDFIGYCGLIVGRATVDEPELAYELLRRAHGQGYATEAARAVVGAAAATGRERLWSTVGSWNTPSLRVLDKLGFARHHVTEDDRGGEVVWLTRSLIAPTGQAG